MDSHSSKTLPCHSSFISASPQTCEGPLPGAAAPRFPRHHRFRFEVMVLGGFFGVPTMVPTILLQSLDWSSIQNLKGFFGGVPPKWRFPIHGGTPGYHPFLAGIFHYKPSMKWGTIIYGNPQIRKAPCFFFWCHSCDRLPLHPYYIPNCHCIHTVLLISIG